MVAYDKMEELDRWALNRLQELIKKVRTAYGTYQFHVVYYSIYNFCTVELSALYLDALKDRLYTSRKNSLARRSAQSAMFTILDTLTKLLAPILAFSAEEIWSAMPSSSKKAASIHLELFPQVNEKYLNKRLADNWQMMITVKGEISKAVEAARKAKTIGHSLDA